MRAIFLLLGAIIVLSWFAFELRKRNRELSQVLVALAAVLTVLLVGAFFGLY